MNTDYIKGDISFAEYYVCPLIRMYGRQQGVIYLVYQRWRQSGEYNHNTSKTKRNRIEP